MNTLAQLQDRFGINGVARFEAGENGLVRLVITGPQAQGCIYLHGAHVTQWQPNGHQPVLFMSQKSMFAADKPLRGGVPVIFPWFGPRAGDASAPIHGFARLRDWDVDGVAQETDGSVSVKLSLKSDAATSAIWAHDFALQFTARFGRGLEMVMRVTNTSSAEFTFEEALHTYFAVGDVRQVAVSGLGGVTFIDKMDSLARKPQGPEPIRITAETDRVYLNTPASAVIDDPSLGRRITVGKEGSNATVVWNPWIAKAKAMADFGDEEWPGMICVETCNCADNVVKLAAGRWHEMKAILRVDSL